ncbi:MAG: DUF3179 domain-containing protein [Anaerolineales bacterium]
MKIYTLPLMAIFIVIFSACAASPSIPNATNAPADLPQDNPPTAPTLLPIESPPIGAEREFITDFSLHTVPYDEILSGGPPKDGIPAIDNPKFVDVKSADEWLTPNEPVVSVQVGDEARAYPVQILIWHEIVNDTLNGKDLLVTFCPLCNTAIAFERTYDGKVLDFGTTGRLRYSNLIMYDRQTETWWQQATGDAIAGKFAGSQLAYYPAAMIAWQDFRAAHPEGSVLSRETGFSRDYGRNPYLGYDDIHQTPFLYQGDKTPEKLPPMARVLTLEIDNEAKAYPYATLEKLNVVNDLVGSKPVVVFWTLGTASALDAGNISEGRDVGAAVAFSREVGGRTLAFAWDGEAIRDAETNSLWNIFGAAVDGALKGSQLSALPAINHFWFSWAAFKPETKIYQP